MNYDSFCMAAAAHELATGVLGAFVDQIHQPAPLEITLAFTGNGPRRIWLLSADARWPRAHETRVRRVNPDTAPGFCMLLRKYLRGARLQTVEQVRFDRILRLGFRRGDETCFLVLEVMGRHSNLLLLDAEQTILGAVKMVPPALTRVRPILPGHPYTDPPGARPDPRRLDPAALTELLAGATTPEAITRSLSGWGTFAAREALAHGDAPAGAVAAMMRAVTAHEFEPRVFLDEQERPRGLWVLPSRQTGWTRSRPAGSLSAACDEFYAYQEAHATEEARRKSVCAALERALRTSRLQWDEAQSALERLDEVEQCRIRGELLSAHQRRVEKGMTALTVPNWYDPEQRPVAIPLEAELDGRENAERYFRRYRRGSAAAEAALERLPELAARTAHLDATLAAAQVADEAGLRALQDREPAARPSAAQGQTGGAGPSEPVERLPAGVRLKHVHVGAWEICYGENATSNDYLTTRVARPDDLWLHARAVTGAHVVIRSVRSLDRLPPEVLREAARLAAAHSEAKHAGIVPVDYTFRRHVRKPRGSAPGRVVYSRERTLHVEPSRGARRE